MKPILFLPDLRSVADNKVLAKSLPGDEIALLEGILYQYPGLKDHITILHVEGERLRQTFFYVVQTDSKKLPLLVVKKSDIEQFAWKIYFHNICDFAYTHNI